MILGKGSAHTDQVIFDEYRQFLDQSGDVKNAKLLKLMQQAPECMQRRIGKPLAHWTDDEILGLYQDRKESTWFRYNAFLAFLLFRGYRRASFRLLTEFPGGFFLPRFHWEALVPLRHKLEQTQAELGYFPQPVGGELNVLSALLAWAYKPLEAITRADFDAFRDLYQDWYQHQCRRKDGHPDPHVKRLEFYLIHWGLLPKATVAYRHDEHFAFLPPGAIRSAILAFLTWGEAKYKSVTVKSYRAALKSLLRMVPSTPTDLRTSSSISPDSKLWRTRDTCAMNASFLRCTPTRFTKACAYFSSLSSLSAGRPHRIAIPSLPRI